MMYKYNFIPICLKTRIYNYNYNILIYHFLYKLEDSILHDVQIYFYTYMYENTHYTTITMTYTFQYLLISINMMAFPTTPIKTTPTRNKGLIRP